MPTGSPGQQRARPTVVGPALVPRTASSPAYVGADEARVVVTAYERFMTKVGLAGSLSIPSLADTATVPDRLANEILIIDRLMVMVPPGSWDGTTPQYPVVALTSAADIALVSNDVFAFHKLEPTAAGAGGTAIINEGYTPGVIVPAGAGCNVIVYGLEATNPDSTASIAVQYRRAVVT